MQKKSLTKFSTHLLLKLFLKMGIEKVFLNIVKAIYYKPTANIILNGEKLKTFSLSSGTTMVPTFTTIIQHSSGSPGCSNHRRK